MRQLMALIGFSYLGATVAAVYFGAESSMLIGMIFSAVFLISLIIPSVRKTRVFPISFAIISIAMIIYSYNYTQKVTPVKALDGAELNIIASVEDIPYDTDSGTVYTFRVLSHDNACNVNNFRIKVSKTYALDDISPYDKISCKVKLYSPSGGAFSSESYLLARNIYMTGYIKSVYGVFHVSQDDKPLYSYALYARECVDNVISSLISPTYSGMCSAVLLGSRNNLNSEFKQDIAVAGVSHVLAVSGLHLSIIISFLMLIFKRIFKKKQFVAVFSIISVLCFMAIAGFLPSVCRAGIVIITALIGEILGAKRYRFAGIGFAALLIPIINPFIAGDIGMLLSFTSSLGIMLFARPIADFLNNRIYTRLKFINKIFGFIFALIGVSVAANITSLPITVLCFKSVSTFFILGNLLILPAAEILLVSLLIMVILYLIPFISFMAEPFAIISMLMCRYITWAAGFIADIPSAYVNSSYRFIAVWIALTMIIAAVVVLFNKGMRYAGKAAIASVVILIAGICSDYIMNVDMITVAVLDTGGGYSVVMNYNGNSAVIVCNGDEYMISNVNDYLCTNTQYVSFVLASDDKSVTKMLCSEIINNFAVDRMLGKEDNLISIKSTAKSNCDYATVEDESRIILWGMASIDTLAYKDGICTFIDYAGTTISVIPDGIDLSYVDKRLLNSDVCILGSNVKSLDLISSGAVVIGGDESNSDDAAVALYDKNKSIISLCDNKSVIFELTDKKEIYVRRELIWLS